jgi:hypothetical protein
MVWDAVMAAVVFPTLRRLALQLLPRATVDL